MKRDLTVQNPNPLQQPQGGGYPLPPELYARGPGVPEPLADEKIPWGRYFKAIWRFKFLIVAVIAIGTGGAYYYAKSLPAEYIAGSGIIVRNIQRGDGVGPVRAEGSMTAAAWLETAKSPIIIDSVVKKLKLHVRYANPADSALFRDFSTAADFRAGKYVLRSDTGTANRLLITNMEGTVLDSAAVGDSIGGALGFMWLPRDMGSRAVEFEVSTLRDANLRILKNLKVGLEPEGATMTIVLTGGSPKLITETVNQITTEFINYASFLTRASFTAVRKTVEEQLAYADSQWRASMNDLEQHRIETVVAQTNSMPFSGGSPTTTNPAITGYMNRRASYTELAGDLNHLREVLPAVEGGRLEPSILTYPSSVVRSGSDLPRIVQEYQTARAKLQADLNQKNPTSSDILTQQADLDRMMREQILPAARSLIAQLETQSELLAQSLRADSVDMIGIPSITIKDMMLQADQAQRQRTYDGLSAKYADAKMAEMSAIPDVQFLYPAVEPSTANTEAATRIFVMMVLSTIAIAVGLAVVLDRLDRKFRYPDQATRELGLTVLGVVPRIKKIKTWQADPSVAASVVEAFRTVRLALANAFAEGEPVTVAISSPGIGDGKSLVAANLALALSEGGYRCLLIDGDTRRGEMHTTFGIDRRPGLLDHLAGRAGLGEILRETSHENLWVMPSGTRFRQGPELLMTQAVKPMLDELKSRFDAIIIDTPPLGAGVDAFVLGTAVNNLLLVLRAGRSDRKLAEAKLDLLDRLPVRVIGAVLNGVNGAKGYEYYTYLDGYAVEGEEEDLPSLAPGGMESGELKSRSTGRALTTKSR